MIKRDDCQKIGHVLKSHGVRGELIFLFEIDIVENLQENGQIFIEIDGYLVPFFIEKIKIKSNTYAIVKLVDVENKEYAKKLTECNILVYNSDISGSDNDIIAFTFIGFTFVDNNSGKNGLINEILDFSGNKNFKVIVDKKEFLIPVAEEFIISIDEKNKTIEMNLPDGLFDIN